MCQSNTSRLTKTTSNPSPAPVQDVDDDLFSGLDWDSLDAEAAVVTEEQTSVKDKKTRFAPEKRSIVPAKTNSDQRPARRNDTPISAPALEHSVLVKTASKMVPRPSVVDSLTERVPKTAAQTPVVDLTTILGPETTPQSPVDKFVAKAVPKVTPRPVVIEAPTSSPDFFEEMDIVHGRMDERLRVSRPPPPAKPTKAAQRKRATPKTPKEPRQPKAARAKATPKAKPSDPTPAPAPISKSAKTAVSAKPPKPPKYTHLEPDLIEGPPPLPAVPSPTKDSPTARPFRRVVSENDVPIPSTAGAWEELNAAATDLISNPPIPAPAKPKRKLQRSKSLAVGTGAKKLKVAVVEKEREPILPPPPPIDHDVGAWSTEACDLFDWRPPGWRDEEGNEVGKSGMLVGVG
ncbi:uncharacterized protein BDZ99DRAFT_467674 [Mytilinidion resinicola]|uniref:Uncharacterized protein n=1 Tax=Mytilinidion resinicola TaxID=574789 RepID=A0A6A6Y6X6_9PEZI|nr:uncharacterized protein BDZ99DRAFT_467674 [Mytilinidion resinicola]KAF2803945.1 hypothetical protein BDZ99DRAFT_467674 [Mytilinidion resinicola]